MLRNILLPAALLLFAAALSCRVSEVRLPETGATLEGTITYDGQPVPLAMILVVGDSGTATGYVGEDGRYRVENVSLGQVRIGVNTDAARGQWMSQVMASSYKGPGGKGPAKPAPKFVAVPAKYAEPERSGLTTTTQEGNNTFDIQLAK